jgi:hypothetical protein
MITISPWVTRNYIVFGKLIILKTNIGYNFWVGNNPNATGGTVLFPVDDYTETKKTNKAISEMDEAETNRFFVNKSLAFIKNNPSTFLKLCLLKFKNFWWVIESKIKTSEKMENYIQIMYFTYGIPLFLSTIGIFLSWKSRKYSSLIWLLFLSFSFVYSIMHMGNYRYRLPVEPFLLIFASVAVIYVFEFAKTLKHKYHLKFSTKR